MEPSPGQERRALLGVPLLGLLWGLNWPAVRISLTEFPPWTLRAAGLGTGALLLFGIALARGQRIEVRGGHRVRLVVSALLTVAVFNILVTFAQLAGTTSRAAIVTYTMPIWTIALAWMALGERPDRPRQVALVLGIGGLALLALPLLAAGGLTIGIAYALAAGISWAAGTVYLKRYPIDGAPLPVTAWQLLIGSLASALGMLLFEGRPPVPAFSAPVVAAFGYHVVFAIAAGYLLWFEVIARLPAAVAALGMLMVPTVGVLGAIAILGERPTPTDVAGFVLILGAAALALLPARR